MTKLGRAVSGAFWMSLVACASRPAPAPETASAPVSIAKAPDEPDAQTTEAPVVERPVQNVEPASIVCDRKSEFGPVLLDAATYPSRRGASARRFSEVVTSKQEPIEACGVVGSLLELTRLRCDDGTNPFPTPEAAHGSRSGNVGAGGRCGSIVDLYKVHCREKTYDVFIDMYMCPAQSTAS